MWKRFKQWLCRSEFQRMEEWLEYERQILHEDAKRRDGYMHERYYQVMRENDQIKALLTEKAMLEPGPLKNWNVGIRDN